SSPFCLHSHADHRALHSFPTRRSSDLNTSAPPLSPINATLSSSCFSILAAKDVSKINEAPFSNVIIPLAISSTEKFFQSQSPHVPMPFLLPSSCYVIAKLVSGFGYSINY